MESQESETTKQLNHHHSTYKLIEHYSGMVIDAVGQIHGIEKQVCKGFPGDVKHIRTAAQKWFALAQEQIWHDQQQQQAGTCLNKNMSHSEMI